MPKIRTNRGAAKRFKRTATGFKHKQSFRNHMLTKKRTKRKRHLRKLQDIAPADVPSIRRLMPGK